MDGWMFIRGPYISTNVTVTLRSPHPAHVTVVNADWLQPLLLQLSIENC